MIRNSRFNKKKKSSSEFKEGMKLGGLSIAVGAIVGVPLGLGFGIYTAYQSFGIIAGGNVALGALTGGLGVAGMITGAVGFCVAGLLKDDFRDREESFARGLGRNIVSLTASLALLAGGMKSMQYASSVGADSLNEIFPKKQKPSLNIECKDKFNNTSVISPKAKGTIVYKLSKNNLIVNKHKI